MKIERKKRRIKIKGRSVPRDRTFHSVALTDEKERERRGERGRREEKVRCTVQRE